MPIGNVQFTGAAQPPPFGNTAEGEYLGQRVVGLNPAAATTRRLTANDSGTTFVNLSTNVMTYLLPGPIAGAEFTFATPQNPADVVTATGAIMYGKNDGTANTTMTFTGTANNFFNIRCDGTFWYTVTGTAAKMNFT